MGGRSMPEMAFCAPSSIKPTFFAMLSAVKGWSPVIITILMPAFLHVSIAPLMSNRGGSKKPIMPMYVKEFKYSFLSISAASR